MRTYRGVVCEKNKKYMVFLTEKGEFLRGVPIGDSPEVGEEADFKLVTPSLIVGGKTKQRFVGAVLVAAALLFFIMSTLSPLNEKVMAYVQLEAGTAMEFEVNRKGNVISLRYLNETTNDPDRLSAWEGLPILSVLDMAVMEFSVKDKQIIITTIYPNEEDKRETRETIGTAVQEVHSKHEQLDLEIIESTPEERTVANKKKMSIHQFKSTQNEESFNDKQPDATDQVKEKPEQGQKLKKDTVPPTVQPQPKGIEKERSNRSVEHQDPPAEKLEKKPNEKRSENVPPQADQKDPPSSPPGLKKQGNGNQGNPHKPEKEKPENEKPGNEKKTGSGSPS